MLPTWANHYGQPNEINPFLCTGPSEDHNILQIYRSSVHIKDPYSLNEGYMYFM
jgi:hypothetical protein